MKKRQSRWLAILVMLILSLACGRFARSTEEPQPAASSPTSEVPVASNPCANVFLPFERGNQWIYQVKRESGEDAKTGITVSKVEDSQATLDMLNLSTGAIIQTVVECEQGAIMNYPAISLGTLFGNMVRGNVTIASISGVYMPGEKDFLASNWTLAWDGEYITNGTLTVEDENKTIAIILEESPVRMEWRVEGQEPVTVQAGTYDQAYKFRNRTEMDAKIDLEGLVVEATLIIETEQWYQAGLGLLKSEVDSASLGYRGITFPIYAKGEVELVEFRSGE